MSRKGESLQPRDSHQRAYGSVGVPGVYEAVRRMGWAHKFRHLLEALLQGLCIDQPHTPHGAGDGENATRRTDSTDRLLYEQRRDKQAIAKGDEEGGRPAFVPGFRPIKFLSQTPSPPTEQSLVQACKHLLEVGALVVVQGNREQHA